MRRWGISAVSVCVRAFSSNSPTEKYVRLDDGKGKGTQLLHGVIVETGPGFVNSLHYVSAGGRHVVLTVLDSRKPFR